MKSHRCLLRRKLSVFRSGFSFMQHDNTCFGPVFAEVSCSESWLCQQFLEFLRTLHGSFCCTWSIRGINTKVLESGREAGLALEMEESGLSWKTPLRVTCVSIFSKQSQLPCYIWLPKASSSEIITETFLPCHQFNQSVTSLSTLAVCDALIIPIFRMLGSPEASTSYPWRVKSS